MASCPKTDSAGASLNRSELRAADLDLDVGVSAGCQGITEQLEEILNNVWAQTAPKLKQKVLLEVTEAKPSLQHYSEDCLV